MTLTLHEIADFSDYYTEAISASDPVFSLRGMMAGDPLFQVAHTNPGDPVLYDIFAADSNSTWRTRAYDPDKNMWFNFKLFQDVLSGRKFRKGSGNWKPRTRVTLMGAKLYGATLTSTTFAQKLNYFDYGTGPDIKNIETNCFIGPLKSGGSWFISTWDEFQDFASRVLDECSAHGTTSFQTQYKPSYNSNNLYRVQASNLVVNDDYVSYDAIWYFFYDYNRYYYRRLQGSVVYRKSANVPYISRHVTLSSYKRIQGTTTVQTYAISHGLGLDEYVPIVTPMDSTIYLGSVVDASTHSILGAAPVLYLTQSKALTSLLGDVSSNFESLIENAELIGLLKDIAIVDTYDDLIEGWTDELGKVWKSGAKKFPPVLRKIDMFINFLRFLAAGYLAYIFAIKPSLESLFDAIQRSTILPQKKYENTLSISSDDFLFTELEEGLQKFALQGMDILPDDVYDYQLTFHTEVVPEVTFEHMLTLCKSPVEAYLKAVGAYPSPIYAWQGTPFSWVADRYFHITELMTAFDNFFTANTSVVGGVGHSVFVRLKTVDGYEYIVYLRSDNSSQLIHPPSSVWFTPTDTTMIRFPLALIGLLGISS